jgi:hypothetical protein
MSAALTPSMRLEGRACGAVALQWYLRSDSQRWVDRFEFASSLALLGMMRSKMSRGEIEEWKAGFREGLGNLPSARRLVEASLSPSESCARAESS